MDAIAEKLEKAGDLRFIVHGNKKRLGSLAKRWTLDEQVKRAPEVKELSQKLRALDRFKEQLVVLEDEARSRVLQAKSLSSAQKQESQELLDSILEKLRVNFQSQASVVLELQRARVAARLEICAQCQVVHCTVAATSSLMSDHNEDFNEIVPRLSAAIFDEAGTSPEQILPLILSCPNMDRIIAIGDHKQLPPFTNIDQGGMCYDFQKGMCTRRSCKFSHVKLQPGQDLSRGFFQRLQAVLTPARVPMLSKQYRMHPLIAEYISTTYYKGQLETLKETSACRLQQDAKGMYWINTSSQEDGRNSKTNDCEADTVLEAYQQMERALRHKSVMVITFYKAQENLIRKKFLRANILEGDAADKGLRILTVDQSQGLCPVSHIITLTRYTGSEADVVILSCVRSNPEGKIGFLDKTNRVNVAVSRARSRIVVIGDSGTLCVGSLSHWTNLRRACQKTSVECLPQLHV